MADRRVLLDTGPLVALLAEKDSHHRRCVEAFDTLTPPLFTCWPVLTEAAWLLRTQPQFFDRITSAQTTGLFKLLPLEDNSLTAIAATMRRYQDSGLQLADAALIHLAEQENIRSVFTLDR